MMYSRIKLSRNLLTEDGVIFISINDVEIANLLKICDSIFGENNFITSFVRKGSGGRQDSSFYAVVHEYVLCYTKNKEKFVSGKIIKENESYPFFDSEKNLYYKTQLLRKWGENSRRVDRPNLFYPIIDPDGNEHYPMLSENEEGCWRWGKETMQKNIADGLVEFKKRGLTWVAYEKIFEPSDGNFKTKLYTTIIDDVSNSTGASLLKELLGDKVFSYPKPVDFLNKILGFVDLKPNDIVLDFFSGSGTTAHSVMELNANKNLNIKYIMVQLLEKCDEKSDAYKNGYNTICEIGEERIRRASKKIKEETNADIDYGFRVYKVDSSNMKNVYYTPSDLDQTQLGMFDSNIKEDRTAEDLLTQVILDLGLTLDLKIEEKNILNNKVYFVDENSLVACFDDELNIDIVDEICKCNPLKVVFKDDSFKNDSDKINLEERFKMKLPNIDINVL